jgi:hypothetical protein
VNITTATPAEIDAALAPIWTRLNHAADEIARATKHIKEAEARNRALSPFYIDMLTKAETALALAKAEAAPLEAEYTRRGGWTRFFMVMNNGGHLHSSTNCSTCRWTTQFAWMPEFSGQDEAGVVDMAGEDACTVCFPSAPVEQRSMLPFRVQERAAKEAAAAERAAKKEAQLAKAINADGSEWRVMIDGYRERFKTIRSVELAIHNQLTCIEYYGDKDGAHAAAARVLAEKLQERTGKDATTTLQEISVKVHKKVAKERRARVGLPRGPTPPRFGTWVIPCYATYVSKEHPSRRHTMSTKTQTIKASEIRVNDTITYCGETFTAERIERWNGLVTVTPAEGGCKQVMGDERDVVITGKRGYKVASIHFNPFTAPETVKVIVGERTRGEFQMGLRCGNRPNAVAFASTPDLITCDRCNHMARYGK